jgi:hypothetical protein
MAQHVRERAGNSFFSHYILYWTNRIMGIETFATSQYHDSVLKVRRFMFDDIDKTIGLADNPNVGAPNFLLALGLCCYTEYWGKLLTGISKFDASMSRIGLTSSACIPHSNLRFRNRGFSK